MAPRLHVSCRSRLPAWCALTGPLPRPPARCQDLDPAGPSSESPSWIALDVPRQCRWNDAWCDIRKGGARAGSRRGLWWVAGTWGAAGC